MKEISPVSLSTSTDAPNISRLIYTIRNQQVMLASDLAACQRPCYALLSGDTSSESGCEAESEKISRKILFPVNQRGSGKLDITNCDVKFLTWRAAHSSLRLYRTGHSNAVGSSPQ